MTRIEECKVSVHQSCYALALLVQAMLIHRLFTLSWLPEVEASDDIVTQLVFVCIQNLDSLALHVLGIEGLFQHTSLVEVCSHLMFFAVTMCTKPPLSICR